MKRIPFVIRNTRLSQGASPEHGFGFIRYAHFLMGPKPGAPLRNIFSIMRGQGCSFLVEEEIESGAYDAENDLIERLRPHFRPLKRRILQLTFFRTAERTEEFVLPASLDDHPAFLPILIKETGADCLGCIRVHEYLCRGIRLHHFVRSAIIRSDEQSPAGCYCSGSFVHCRTMYRVKVGADATGLDFLVPGVYFAQQEGTIWCCAHSAIEMVVQQYVASIRGGELAYWDHETYVNQALGIDHFARRASDGLRPAEIIHILKQRAHINSEALDLECGYWGADADTYGDDRVISSAYYAVEALLPAILNFQAGSRGHAITVVGHAFNPTLWSHRTTPYFRGKDRPYNPSHAWVDALIVMDDNVGPFCTMPRQTLWRQKPIAVLPRYRWSNLVTPEEVERVADRHLRFQEGSKGPTYFQQVLKTDFGDDLLALFWFQQILDHVNDKTYVQRVTAISGKHYLEFMEEPHDPCMPKPQCVLDPKQKEDILPLLKEKLKEQQAYWLAEISIPGLYGRNNHRLGELLLEEHAHLTQKLRVVLIRMPGVLSIAERGGPMRHFQIVGQGHFHILDRDKSHVTFKELAQLRRPS